MNMLLNRDILLILILSIIRFTCGEIKKSHAVVKVKSVRIKRALPASAYSQADKDAILAKHNEYRKAEPSSNMQLMVGFHHRIV